MLPYFQPITQHYKWRIVWKALYNQSCHSRIQKVCSSRHVFKLSVSNKLAISYAMLPAIFNTLCISNRQYGSNIRSASTSNAAT